MKAASLSDIRSELKELSPARLSELVLRLARFKKDNKELLSFLLFEEGEMDTYLAAVKEEITEELSAVNRKHMHLAKKTIRRVQRITNKHIRYTGSKEAEVVLLLHFVREVKALHLPLHRTPVLSNLYAAQAKKIRAALASLHEDLQHEYASEVEQVLG